MNKDTVATLRQALAYARSIIDTVREPMMVLNSSLYVQTASGAFYRTFGVSREDTEGRFIYDLGNGQRNIPAFRALLEDVTPQGKAFPDSRSHTTFPGWAPRHVD
jgi:two-component system CheB/CheR fusion protein